MGISFTSDSVRRPAVHRSGRSYLPVLVEWDDTPFARKRFVVWASDPEMAGAFAKKWLDYVERVGTPADLKGDAWPIDIRLHEGELERLWPGGGDVENLTGRRARRMRDLLGLVGPWRRARILWVR